MSTISLLYAVVIVLCFIYFFGFIWMVCCTGIVIFEERFHLGDPLLTTSKSHKLNLSFIIFQWNILATITVSAEVENHFNNTLRFSGTVTCRSGEFHRLHHSSPLPLSISWTLIFRVFLHKKYQSINLLCLLLKFCTEILY